MEQEKNTLTVLEIAPGQYPKQVEIDPDLKALQQAVGGNIGASYPFADDPVAIIYNDDAATFLGVLALVGLAAGGGIYTFMKQKQKKQAEKEALDPDANYTEDKGDFEIPTDVPDEDEAPDEQDTEPI